MIVPLVKACQDRQLLGATLQWRPKQLEVLDLFGDDALRLVVVSAGRQGGKSSMAVATAIWGATMRDDLDQLLPRGRTRFALIACPSEDQSRELIRVAAGMVDGSPVLRGLATVKADRIDFALPSGAKSAIQALPANPRTVRGMTASIVIGDEAAHWQSDAAGVNNDMRMIEALEGSMSVFDAHGQSKMLLISTPAGEIGRFFELFRDVRDGVLHDAAVVHAPAWTLNPRLDNEDWKESKRRLLGVDGFDQEHGAVFTTGSGQLMDLRGVEFADGPARPEEGRNWVCGMDPGFHADRYGVCLVGESIQEPGVLIVGAVDALAPGDKLRSLDLRRGREDRTLAKVWEIIEPYAEHGLRAVSDQHQQDAIQSYFGRLGVAVDIVNLTGPVQTQAFVATRTRLVDGSLRLWRHPGLIEDLRRVKARDASEAVLLPRYAGGHCDSASALALAVLSLRYVDGSPDGELIAGTSSWAADVRDGLDDQRAGGSLAPTLTSGLLSQPL